MLDDYIEYPAEPRVHNLAGCPKCDSLHTQARRSVSVINSRGKLNTAGY